jgi:hypothetical protein
MKNNIPLTTSPSNTTNTVTENNTMMQPNTTNKPSLFVGTLYQIKEKQSHIPQQIIEYFISFWKDQRIQAISEEMWKTIRVDSTLVENRLQIIFSRRGEEITTNTADWKINLLRYIAQLILEIPPTPASSEDDEIIIEDAITTPSLTDPSPTVTATTTIESNMISDDMQPSSSPVSSPTSAVVVTTTAPTTIITTPPPPMDEKTKQLITIYVQGRRLICTQQLHRMSFFNTLTDLKRIKILTEARQQVLDFCKNEPFQSEIKTRPILSKAQSSTKRVLQELSTNYTNTAKRAHEIKESIFGNSEAINNHVGKYGTMHQREQLIALNGLINVINNSNI